MFFNAFSLFTPATGPVYNRAHTPINLGCVTGNYYQTGIVQECLCIKLPLIPFGDSRMQRLSEVEFPLATSPEAHSKCSTT